MPRPDGRRHTLADFYHEDTSFDFLHRKWRWALVSGVFILAGVVGFLVNDGLNLGLDFTGGTAWQVQVEGKSPSTGDIRDTLASLGVSDPKIIVLGGDEVRVESAEVVRERQDEVTAALAKYAGAEASTISVSEVGPSWGDKVSREALKALGVFFLVVALYLTFRFELKMAIAAIAAVIHDVLVTLGVYAITGFEVTPATVIAFLTILGFSLYDTVVVFDKIKENTAQVGTVKGLTYTAMANRSLNQVLMRSLNTSFVALLPVASLLVVGVGIYGAIALREFGLALFVGLAVGAYSSIFVATPILAWWKEREPRYRALEERSTVRAAREAVGAGAAGAVAPETPAATDVTPEAGVTPPPPVIQPRPRQQKSRRRK
ncbi:MAG: protein translocase subunit SecF [Actinobacteria bacterium]|nr:protein translocase subunit SecF [Actinomycetota bacterium]